MLSEYSKYFKETSSLLDNFSDTLANKIFDEEKDAEEVFNLTTIKLLSQNASSLSILIDNKYYASVPSLLRIIIESFFSINWVIETKDVKEKNNRIYRLEGNTSFHYEKEVKLMEENLKSNKPLWKPEAVKIIRDAVEYEKKLFPYLLEVKNGKTVFKSAPSMAERMSEYRIKFYHLYIFTSFFSHPSPKLKEYFLSRKSEDENPEDKIFEPLARTMTECLPFIMAILGYAVQVYDKYENDNIRLELFNKMKTIAEEGHKTYRKLFKKPT
ncbi:MAG: hypothetical protein STSR0008_24730 [Ignavibacterium sp.]